MKLTNDVSNIIFSLYSYILNSTVGNLIAIHSKTSNTCYTVSTRDSEVLYCTTSDNCFVIAVTSDTTYEALALDARTVVRDNLTVGDSTHLAVAVTYDSTYTISVGSIHLNVTLNSDIRDVCLATFVISETYENTYVMTFSFCSDGNVLDYEVLDSHATRDVTEETTAKILVSISIRLNVEVLDNLVLTVEVSVE